MISLRLLLLAFPVSAGAADVFPMTFVMQVFPPFVQYEKGRPSGPFPDILRAVCGAMHAECKQEVYPWRRANAMVVINLELAQYLMQPEGDAGLKQVGELQKTEYYIGLSRKKLPPQQVETFNATLLQLLRDGTVAAIAKKYGLTAAPAN